MIAPARAALLALCLGLHAASASAQGVTPRTVVLGQSAPLSGAQQALGEEIRAGTLAYLRALNDAGGVHGRRIELATLDDAGDPARALANTRRLVGEFKVFALFAYPESSATPEALALAQRERVPVFAPLSGAARARQPGRAVYTVRAGRASEADAAIGHYAQLGAQRFALLRGEGEAGAEYLEGARDALERRGLPPPADALLGKDAAAAVGQALAANPQVLILALAQPPAADMVRAAKRGGGAPQIVALSGADPARLAAALGPAGAGVALAQVVPPLERVSLPVVADYRRAYQAETRRRDFTPASLEAYIAAKVLAEAIRRAGPELTREAFVLALDAMTFYDAGGHVVGFSRSRRQGSATVYLQLIDSRGALLH
jgi:ABC-type branched-subunit amino acid transport system substrate-binding protein